MDLSIFNKLFNIFKYMFSSFLSVELVFISILLLILLLFTFKYKNRGFRILLSTIYIYSFFTIIICNSKYVLYCIDSFLSKLMNYIYFPSTVIYFFIIFGVIILLIITINSLKITRFKRVFNYMIFSILILLYTLFLSIVISNSMNLADKISLYKNDLVLSIVQISNFILVLWIMFTFFYKLFIFYKNKFDEKIEN